MTGLSVVRSGVTTSGVPSCERGRFLTGQGQGRLQSLHNEVLTPGVLHVQEGHLGAGACSRGSVFFTLGLILGALEQAQRGEDGPV